MMTIPFQKGRYIARVTQGATDIRACQKLRHHCFFGRSGLDADAFDDRCHHVLVEDMSGRVVSTARLLPMLSPDAVLSGYSAQFYGLDGLAGLSIPMGEVGRFCTAPDVMNADVLRVVWGALIKLVDAMDIKALFGCTSFSGVDPQPYLGAFDLLRTRHVGPNALRPTIKAAEVVRFADLGKQSDTRHMPPLLRTYLAMGGWVSDHAVVDRQMNTLHMFTCVDVDAVPRARARALRALAG